MAKNKTPSIAGGLGMQGYNAKDYMTGRRIRTGSTTPAAIRDKVYGGAPTPKKPSSMISLPGTAMKMLGQKFSTKYTPGSYAAYRKAMATKKPAVAAAKPVVKPPVKKPPVVVTNAIREKLSPNQNSSISKKPPATRFGTVTGKTTGTRVSGGGGYGGGGTRGGGSLSGGGSGTRSAGTSRTGGTQRNDPVRG